MVKVTAVLVIYFMRTKYYAETVCALFAIKPQNYFCKSNNEFNPKRNYTPDLIETVCVEFIYRTCD